MLRAEEGGSRGPKTKKTGLSRNGDFGLVEGRRSGPLMGLIQLECLAHVMDEEVKRLQVVTKGERPRYVMFKEPSCPDLRRLPKLAWGFRGPGAWEPRG